MICGNNGIPVRITCLLSELASTKHDVVCTQNHIKWERYFVLNLCSINPIEKRFKLTCNFYNIHI
jgi:hypothetical protein